MKSNPVLIFLTCLGMALNGYAQSGKAGYLRGELQIDTTWSSKIYLSYLPTFEDIYAMSSEMIIAETKIDKDGRFLFDLDYLPEQQRLYRLHITKKGDSRSSLIIGGKYENYVLLIANKNSKINFKAISVYPPFRTVMFSENEINSKLQQITNLIYTRDSIASVSDVFKRRFIDDKLQQELLSIADSTKNALISMYAVYQSGFESDYKNNTSFYEDLAEKWSDENNANIKNFKSSFPQAKPNHDVLQQIAIALAFLCVGIIMGKYIQIKNQRIKNLSVQERKILEELRKGSSNKDISEKFNIGLSTVKSHVSSILSKMNVKSRKDLMFSK